MQQKYLWGAAAVIVLGAVAAYVGVDYAYHHPASLLAKFGEAATFGGLNPNPLSDVSALLNGKGVRRPVIEARINHPAKSTVPIVSTDTEEETIEPIQVEAIPPATAEPPTSAEESEDRGGFYTAGEFYYWKKPKPVVPIEDPNEGLRDKTLPVQQAPKPTPYADEDQTEDAKPCEACPVMKMLRGLGNMCWGLSNTGLWEAIEDWGSKGGCSGCLEWYEYSTPERIPVMPTEIQQNEDEPDSTAFESPRRFTHIIQLFSANAADVVTAVQKYIGDLIEMYPPTGTCTNCVCESLKHDIVLVAEPVTNKVVVNVPAAFYEELLQLIHQLDKEPVTDQCQEGCYHGCGQRCGTSCCPMKPETTEEGEGSGDKQAKTKRVVYTDAAGWVIPATLQLIEAENKVFFETSDARGRADFVIVDTEKGTIVLKGSPGQPAKIHRVFGGAASVTQGQMIIYNWKSNTLTCGENDNSESSSADRTDGGIAPRTPGIDEEEMVEKPLCDGCCKDGAKLCNPAVGSGRKISVAFDNVPLCNCIETIKKCFVDNNIVIDEQAIQAAGIHMDQPVTLNAKDFDVKTALEVLLKQTGLKCVVDKNVITITTEERAK